MKRNEIVNCVFCLQCEYSDLRRICALCVLRDIPYRFPRIFKGRPLLPRILGETPHISALGTSARITAALKSLDERARTVCKAVFREHLSEHLMCRFERRMGIKGGQVSSE